MSILLATTRAFALALPLLAPLSLSQEVTNDDPPLILNLELIEKVTKGETIEIEGYVFEDSGDYAIRFPDSPESKPFRLKLKKGGERIAPGSYKVTGVVRFDRKTGVITLIEVADILKLEQAEQDSIEAIIGEIIALNGWIETGASDRVWVGNLERVKIVAMALSEYFRRNQPALYQRALDRIKEAGDRGLADDPFK